MDNQYLKVSAENLDKARKRAISQIPKGLALISEEIIFDGKIRTARGIAKNIEFAYKNAEKTIPENATIVSKEEINIPKEIQIEIKAFTIEDATTISKKNNEYLNEISKIDLIQKGKRGFLGFGKEENVYKIRGVESAVVEIKFKPIPTIQIEYGKKKCNEIFEQSPLMLALYKEEFDKAKKMINDRIDFHTYYKYEPSPLLWCVSENKTELVKLLVEKGADLNEEIKIDRMQFLIDKKEGKEKLEIMGNVVEVIEYTTPIDVTILRAQPDMTKFLVGLGANINNTNKTRLSYLHFAASRFDKLIVEYLLSVGFDINYKGYDGYTALVYTIISARSEVPAYKEVIGSLIDKGSDLNYSINMNSIANQTGIDDFKKTGNVQVCPLEIALLKGFDYTAELMVKMGANTENVKADNLSEYGKRLFNRISKQS